MIVVARTAVTAFVLLITQSMEAQQSNPPGDGPPQPIPWVQPWRESTVAIGEVKDAEVSKPDGKTEKKKVFVPVGTGVLMLTGPDNAPTGAFLVTAKHVFSDPTKKWTPTSVRVRFSWLDSRPVDEYLGVELKLENGDSKLWIAHQDAAVDLACIPVRFSSKDLERPKGTAISYSSIATDEDFFEGAAVAVLGYPGAVGPTYWTKAILRYGIVSWVSPSILRTALS